MQRMYGGRIWRLQLPRYIFFCGCHGNVHGKQQKCRADRSSRRQSAMASSEKQAFRPQTQALLPGKQHLMEPAPQSLHPDYKPAGKLQGKVALVTGGDSGIGRAVCLLFALEGASVAFTYVQGAEDQDAQDSLQMLKDATNSAGAGTTSRDPIAIPADVTSDDSCRNAVEQTTAAFGRIDVLVNNAGESFAMPSVAEVRADALERLFRTNVYSCFFMSKHAARHMAAGASIVNTASVDAYRGKPGFTGYGATKGAVVAFTRALALQLADRGVRVNAVAPGPVWTPLIPAANPPDVVAAFGTKVPMGRAAQPYEIAPCYVFLASGDASYITGQVMHPNGGEVVNA